MIDKAITGINLADSLAERSSEYNEFLEILQNIFQEEAKNVYKQVEIESINMKVSEKEIIKNIQFFGESFKVMGLNSKKNADLSMKLAARSMELSLELGLSQEKTNEIVQDAINGQMEAINFINKNSKKALNLVLNKNKGFEANGYELLEKTNYLSGNYADRNISYASKKEISDKHLDKGTNELGKISSYLLSIPLDPINYALERFSLNSKIKSENELKQMKQTYDEEMKKDIDRAVKMRNLAETNKNDQILQKDAENGYNELRQKYPLVMEDIENTAEGFKKLLEEIGTRTKNQKQNKYSKTR